MTNPIHIDLSKADPTVQQICRAAFPSYGGRTLKIRVSESEIHLDSSWSGGSRSLYVAVKLATLEAQAPTVDTSNPFTAANRATAKPQNGVVIVEHSMFCGKDAGLTIHVNPLDAAPMLPASTVELDPYDRKVLNAIAGLKSGPYRQEALAAIPDCAARIVALVEKGLLKQNKAGAVQITVEGRNAR